MEKKSSENVKKKTKGVFVQPYSKTKTNILVVGPIPGDKNQEIVAANNALEKMFGYTKDELSKKSLKILIPKKFHDNHNIHFKNFINSRKSRKIKSDLNLIGISKTGKKFPVEIGLNHFEIGKNIFVFALIIDVSVRKANEKKIHSLKNELEKIDSFILNKKTLAIHDLLKLTNLAENYNVSELIDCCLSKNKKRTINILNENNYSLEDCILIIRTLLIKAKRLIKLSKEFEKTKNLDTTISAVAVKRNTVSSVVMKLLCGGFSLFLKLL